MSLKAIAQDIATTVLKNLACRELSVGRELHADPVVLDDSVALRASR